MKMRKKKEKKRHSVEWTLLMSAGIFFIFGHYIAAEYEAKFLEAGMFEEVYPISKYCVILAGVLLGLFVICLMVRLFRKKG